MNGGTYSITGGYWAAPAILPAHDGPPLEIYSTGGVTYLRWPGTSPGWRLMVSTDLTNWTQVPATPVATGQYLQVPVSLTNGSARQCYQLKFP